MKSIFLAVAVLGSLGLSGSLSARAAEPAVLRVLVAQTTDVPAYVHEIEVLRALYKKQGLAVTIDAYQFDAEVGVVVVAEVLVANMAALVRMDQTTRTQPDLVAEMKKIGGMRKIIFDGLYDKATPAVGVLGPGAPPPVRAAELTVMRVMRVLRVEAADVPGYAYELEALRTLYKKHGLDVAIDAYQGTYAGQLTQTIDVQTLAASRDALTKMDEMTRTQPDLVAQMAKIDGMQKILRQGHGIYNKLTP